MPAVTWAMPGAGGGHGIWGLCPASPGPQSAAGPLCLRPLLPPPLLLPSFDHFSPPSTKTEGKEETPPQEALRLGRRRGRGVGGARTGSGPPPVLGALSAPGSLRRA